MPVLFLIAAASLARPTTRGTDATCEPPATWATKTAWVWERAATRKNVADDSVRRALTEDQLPPASSTVWVARHQGDYNFAAFQTTLELAHRDNHWASGESRTVALCNLTFRGLAFLVRTDGGHGVPAFALPSQMWLQVWPQVPTPAWPPARPVTDQDVNLVTKNLGDWLTYPDVPLFHRSGSWQQQRRN